MAQFWLVKMAAAAAASVDRMKVFQLARLKETIRTILA